MLPQKLSFLHSMGRSWIWPIVLLLAIYLIISSPNQAAMAPFAGTDATPEVRGRVMTFLREFDRVWDASFTHGLQTRDTIRKLVGISSQTQDALHSVKAALPNDTSMHTAWKKMAEAVQVDHFKKLEDLRKRCGASLLYPGPLDDLHYRKWWRAANDHDDDGGASPV